MIVTKSCNQMAICPEMFLGELLDCLLRVDLTSRNILSTHHISVNFGTAVTVCLSFVKVIVHRRDFKLIVTSANSRQRQI